MADFTFIPNQHYWIVEDHTPSGEVYSARDRGYVADTDATYVAYIADTHPATTIPTEDELFTSILPTLCSIAESYCLPSANFSAIFNSGSPAQRALKNYVINPNLIIDQRGYTAGTSTSVGDFVADRWKSEVSGTSILYGVEGSPVQLSASGSISQIIENRGLSTFKQKEITVGLHSPTGSFDIALSKSTGSGAETKTITTGPEPVQYVTFSGVDSVTFTNDIKLVITNTDSVNSQSFRQVTLVIGDAPSPVFPADAHQDLLECLRYYRKPRRYRCSAHGGEFANAANNAKRTSINITFPVPMAKTPTVEWTFHEPASTYDTDGTPVVDYSDNEYVVIGLDPEADNITGDLYWEASIGFDAEL